MKRTRRSRSIYHIVLVPLLVMFVMEMAIITGVPLLSGIVDRLDRSEEELLEQSVMYREGQIESSMGTDWGDLGALESKVDEAVAELMEREGVSMEELMTSTALCDELLLEVTQELITELYIRRVNGIYLMLNTQDLAPLRGTEKMPKCSGLYIRDLDPLSTPSEWTVDLLFERAPIAVVREMGISTTADWKPMFTFDEEEDAQRYDFLYVPFQSAYEAWEVEDAAQYGYWTLNDSAWYEDEGENLVTYSQPLVWEDGTVYGVLGIELREDYLKALLPHEELSLGDGGSYVLAKMEYGEDEMVLRERILSSTRLSEEDLREDMTLRMEDDGTISTWIDGERYYVQMEKLPLYGSSSVYRTEEWVLLGLVKESELYASSRNLERMLGMAALLMLLVGLVGSMSIAERLSRPVQRLSAEVDAQKACRKCVPQLSHCNIREVDHFADAITALNTDVLQSSSRFLRIVQMASGEIGAFEIPAQGEAFMTENFYAMLGIEEGTPLSSRTVQGQIAYLRENVPWIKWNNGSDVFEFTTEDGCTRYINVAICEQEGSTLGLAEDVTALMTERKRIEHDRDYDLLTGLLNRRAFYAKVERIFREDIRAGHFGALLVLDLDHLKEINDQFGHEWGDGYLRAAAWGFGDALPQRSVLARLAGDEFAVLFYGYEQEWMLEAEIESFGNRVQRNVYLASDETRHPVRVSGGMALYPADGREFQELARYADFTLYQVKHAGGNALRRFERTSYEQALYLARNRQELQRLIEERLVEYHFQPIFNARTGEPYAYEALMRVKLPTLHSPMAVLNLARQENRMKDIERLTMERSTECYAALWKAGRVRREAFLFVNSIADQWLETEEQERVGEQIRGFADRVVIEITEHQETDEVALEKKRGMSWFSGLFALDDYGTGYSGEKNLLELSPRFVKLDICLVRGLDTDHNKQQIVSNLLSFAHQREMLVVAEGLETLSEIRTALELGIDLMQGYALAKPAAVPEEISPEAMEVIRRFHAEQSA